MSAAERSWQAPPALSFNTNHSQPPVKCTSPHLVQIEVAHERCRALQAGRQLVYRPVTRVGGQQQI